MATSSLMSQIKDVPFSHGTKAVFPKLKRDSITPVNGFALRRVTTERSSPAKG